MLSMFSHSTHFVEALQACVVASYWQSSLYLASQLQPGNSLESLPADLVSSNLELAALTMSHNWKQALHLLKHDFPQRGHEIDSSTYNSARLEEFYDELAADVSDDEDPGWKRFREYMAKELLQSKAGRHPFQSGDHVLDLHGLSSSSAEKALQLALEDAEMYPRTLLIVTGHLALLHKIGCCP